LFTELPHAIHAHPSAASPSPAASPWPFPPLPLPPAKRATRPSRRRRPRPPPNAPTARSGTRRRRNASTPKKSSFNDDELYKAAREFAYAGQYDNAITALRLAENQNDPRILNYLGYANRKAGRMDLGMSYYRKALQADENYILARSYMGQALMEQGDVQAARVQLVEIRDRGGEDTWAYRALLQSLNGYRTY
jgi:tetratricopeptide (TPR) repeat protein